MVHVAIQPTCIAGSFHEVQIFVDFSDRLVSVKIKAMGVVTSCKKVSCALELRLIEGTNIKTVKISSEGLWGDSSKNLHP